MSEAAAAAPALPPGPWATGTGSMPGTDARLAVDVVVGELGDGHLPFVPELRDRGVGADMVGRAAGFLVDMPVDLQPSGWRLVDRPGRDQARARSFWRQDLDALAERGEELARARGLKVAMAGPWTLAAALQRSRGEVAVSDLGARREVVESLGEGLRGVLADLRSAVPEVPLVVQLDEPSLPAVLMGRVPTASGFATLRSVPAPDLRAGLASLVRVAHEEGAAVVVHCSAADVEVRLLGETGADAVGVTAPRSTRGEEGRAWELLATLAEAGAGLVLGVLDPLAATVPEPDDLARSVLGPWQDLGIDASLLTRVGISSTGGAAGASPAAATAQLTALARAAERIAEGA